MRKRVLKVVLTISLAVGFVSLVGAGDTIQALEKLPEFIVVA